MAKWGEGDPRWIVEEREDFSNVNNWHWTEKNACAWSQEKIKKLFKDMVISGDDKICNITEIEKCEGEAVANNRKGKLIFFYEWNIVLKWSAEGEKKIKGKINIPNLSEEHDVSEVDVEVTLEESTDKGEEYKNFLHTKGKEAVRVKLLDYTTSLREEFSQGMILPKKDESINSKVSNITSTFNSKTQINKGKAKSTSEEKSVGKISTTSIKQNVKFQCRAQEIFNAMTTIEMVRAFTRSDVTLDATKNGKFELFGGNIQGEFLEVAPEKIVQKWRCKHWPSGHFSEVTIKISEKSDHTEIKLTQTGVPKDEEDSTKTNWDRYYWDPIKHTFNFGYFM